MGTMAGTNITITTESLQLGTWTFVTAVFQVYAKDSERSAMTTIYFWDKLHTSLVLQSLFNDYEETTEDEIIVGGFNGIIASLNLVKSGEAITTIRNPMPLIMSLTISIESEVSNQDHCLLGGGFNYQSCFVSHCPKGTYVSEGVCLSCDSSCQTCTGAGPSLCSDEKILEGDNYNIIGKRRGRLLT